MGLKDLLFPKKCIGCGRMGSYICEGCSVGIWEEEQICPGCRRNSRYGLKHGKCEGPLEGLTCLWAYEGLARKLIMKAKYKGYYDYLGELLAANEQRAVSSPEFFYFNKYLEEKPVVVPIPLHPNRLRKRGFNQAEKIAVLVGNYWGLEVKNLIKRIIDTGQQVGRERSERLKVMEGAFQINKKLAFDFTQDSQYSKGILLVDDVWTTGATLASAARTLKKAGVKKVWGFVLAR